MRAGVASASAVHDGAETALRPERSAAPRARARGARATGRTLRVMTYNVRYFGHPTRGLASTGAAFSRIARSLAALDPTPDLVCLQEVETRSIRVDLHQPPLAPGGDAARAGDDRARTRRSALAGKADRYTAYYFPAHAYRLTARTNIYTTGLAVIARDTFTRRPPQRRTSPHDITHRAPREEPQADAHLRARLVRRTRAASPSTSSTPTSRCRASSRASSGPATPAWASPPTSSPRRKTLADFVEREQRSPYFVVVGDFNSLPGSPVDRYLREERGLRRGVLERAAA